ncbi:MAG: hypothetical protein KF729_09085 [Sandaracinaceae bacterium]|nr:hypothetical protein [Sandaracinaceae bacterium]
MTATIKRYFALVDIMREQRRSPSWKAEDDRVILGQLEDWYAELDDADRALVEAAGWRAWPDRFDAREPALIERILDAADDGAVQDLPRMTAAA